MRMIKRHDRSARGFSKSNRLPPHLIRIARLNDIRLFAFQDFSDAAQIEKGAITCRARDQRRTNRIDTRTIVASPLCFFPWNNEDVFVAGFVANVASLFVDIAFHSAAERRVKLGQVTDLQGIADFRLATADFRDAAMIATSSFASFRNGSPRDLARHAAR